MGSEFGLLTFVHAQTISCQIDHSYVIIINKLSLGKLYFMLFTYFVNTIVQKFNFIV